MKKRCSSVLILAVGFSLQFLSAPVPGRVWTDVEGRIVEAKLLKATETTVTLLLQNGKTREVNLDTLSAVDELYVKKWLSTQKPKPGTRPAGPSPAPVSPGGPVKPAEGGNKPASPGTVTPGPEVKPSKLPPVGGKLAETTAAPVGFDGLWPDTAKVPEELNIEIVKEDDSDKDYVYRSTHFEFISDVQLRPRLVSACAKIFEATHEFLRLLPLNHRTTGGGRKYFPVILFENYDDYVKAGGPSGSAGVCITRGNDCRVLVPLKSMGVKKVGKDYSVDPADKDNRVLAHEITHQIMEHAVKQASWYIEGSAEYVANTAYTGGRFKIAVNKTDIVATVTGYGKDNKGGRALGTDLKMPRLEKFMTMSYDTFLSNSGFNYGMGCLLTYYWYHLDGEGDAARMKQYLKALQSGEPEDTARQKLLDGRSWDDMEKIFAKSMRRLGVKIDYKD